MLNYIKPLGLYGHYKNRKSNLLLETIVQVQKSKAKSFCKNENKILESRINLEFFLNLQKR